MSEERLQSAVSRRSGARLSLALRGLRSAGARSDGLRHAGHRVARGLDSGGVGDAASCSIRRRRRLDRGDRQGGERRARCARGCGTPAAAARAEFTWERTARADARRCTSAWSGPMTPDVSVVIVTWNGRQYLDACLGAAAAQQGVTAETILVDNGSTDGTPAYVRARFPAVRLVALAENRGFAGGNNAGAREARGALRRVSEQRHRGRSRAGCARCAPASTSRPGSPARHVAHRVHARPVRHRQRRRRRVPLGRRVQAALTAPRRARAASRWKCSASAAPPA